MIDTSSTILKTAMLIALICLCNSQTVIDAQSPTSTTRTVGKIQGVIFEWNETRVANATITIENSKLKRQVKSVETGDFMIRLPAGIYKLTVEADGFKRFIIESLLVRRSATKTVNIHLEFGAPNDHDTMPTLATARSSALCSATKGKKAKAGHQQFIAV